MEQEKINLIKEFLPSSTLNLLKVKLRKLGLGTTGNKATLTLRLEEAWHKLSIEELKNHVNSDDGDDVSQTLSGNDDEVIIGANGGSSNGGIVRGSESSSQQQNDDDEENLDQEINHLQTILAKKKKIADFRRQRSALEDQDISFGRHQHFNFNDIEYSLPCFSGDDHFPIEKWIEIFNENADALEWTDKMRLVYAKRLLSGTAKLFLRTIVVSSWSELKSKLLQEIRKRVSKAELHEKLRTRKKKHNEPYHQYVLNMLEIASFSDIEENDIVEYIISGITDTEVNKMMLYQANTIDELKLYLKKYETLKQNQHTSKELRQQNSFVNREFNPQKPKCSNFNSYNHHPSKCNFQRRRTNYYNGNGKSAGYKINENNEQNRIMNVEDDARNKNVNNTNTPDDSMNVVNQGFRLQQQTTRSTDIDEAISIDEFEHHMIFKFYDVNDTGTYYVTSLKTLIDSGSPVSFIQEKYVPPSVIDTADCHKYKYKGINGSNLCIVGQVKCIISFNDNNVNMNLFVVKNFTMNNSAVLGRNFIKCNNMVFVRRKDDQINYGLKYDHNNEVKYNDESAVNEHNKNNKESIKATTNFYQGMNDNFDFTNEIFGIELDLGNGKNVNLNINDKLNYETKKKIFNIIEQTWSKTTTVSNSSNNNLTNFCMQIKLNKYNAFYSTRRRLPYSHIVELRKLINDLLERKIIRESSSEYASPIVLVKKKTGELRLCVDYRELNELTVRDNYPLPLIEDMLDRLKGKRFFTTLDLRSGFHHVHMSPDSIKYTAFVTPIGQFDYLKMPFGLKNDPPVFQRYVNKIFKDLIESGKVLIYLDDFMIATESVDEHFQILEQVVDILNKNCLELRYDKCRFLYDEVNYLGYTVNVEGIKPNLENLRAIQNFPIPKSTKEVQGFIGLCSYFRKFIKDFALHARPLYNILKKDSEFHFGENELNAFEFLKSKLLNAPVLSIYSPNSETELHCDASSYGFGAILLQKQSDDKFHRVFYFSKRCTEVESRYHSYELETLSIIYALRRF